METINLYLHILVSKMTLANALRVWNYIMTSNLFNFVIFAIVFVLIFKKINIKKVISSLQESIVKLLDDAKKNKAESLDALSNAQETVKNLSSELETIKNDAQKSVDVVTEKVLNEAHQQVEAIKNNADKVIDAEEKFIVANLTKEAALASVDQARKKIQWELLKDVSLHEKYINQSIDELDRLNF